MIFDRSVQEYENSRLERVIAQIRQQLGAGKQGAERKRKEVAEVQKSMWEHVNPTPGDLDDLANIWQFQTDLLREGRKAIFLSKQAERLEKLLKNPYFARIDFRENGEERAEEIYIGISNLKDEETGEFLIYDWRAPVSSMFYDYEMGHAGYICPAGRIEGDITLKRQYRIWNGILEFMFDSSLAINDEILQEVLGKSADSRMKTIVASIQREQNRIIRDDDHRLLIVQGPAGSGKTSIALHRAAFLLYRYRESIVADNIVIFSPNSIFSDYISDVLPELGEENINRTTFIEYARRVLGEGLGLEDSASQMEYLLNSVGAENDSNDANVSSCINKSDGFNGINNINDREIRRYRARLEGISYKSGMAFAEILKLYAKYIEESRTFDDISYNGKVIESGEEISEYFRHGLKVLPVAKRLEKIRNRLNEKLDAIIKVRIEDVMQELAELGEYLDKAEIKGRSTFIVREEFNPIREKIGAMTELGLLDCYIGMFTDEKFMEVILKHELPAFSSEVSYYTKASIAIGKACFEDIPPLLLLQGLLFGFPSMSSFRHLIIDEMQDYTAVQFELFARLFGHCSMTLLGDANQRIHPSAIGFGAEAAAEILGSAKSTLLRLNKSYRSTMQIAAFCRSLLPDNTEADYIDRPGEKPVLFIVKNPEDIYGLLVKGIIELRRQGSKSIAVITRTARESSLVYERLSGKPAGRKSERSHGKPTSQQTGNLTGESLEKLPGKQLEAISELGEIKLITREDDEFFTGIAVIPSYLSKGLEFDAVLVVCPNDKTYGRLEERKLVYTVCTRALHKLDIYCSGGVPDFMKELEKSLYTEVSPI